MEKNMIFKAEENSFILEVEGKKLRVSYAEHYGTHGSSMQFCKENGGGDETVENWRLIAKYRDDINKELAALGKDLIEGWYWTTEPSWRYDDCAFVVPTDDGYVNNADRHSNYNARAVSAL
jgi:hypothetical protein